MLFILVALLVSRGAARLFRRVRDRAPGSAPSIYIAEKLITYGTVVIGIYMGVSALGVDLSSLSLFAGALGVGLGFGRGMPDDAKAQGGEQVREQAAHLAHVLDQKHPLLHTRLHHTVPQCRKAPRAAL